jgi:site-specific DNA-methyltransferase (adenine-specific)
VKCWTAKAVEETRHTSTLVVALLPARTDTQWFHRHVLPYAHVGYVEGRLTFVGASAPAPFPSIVVTWPAAARVRT